MALDGACAGSRLGVPYLEGSITLTPPGHNGLAVRGEAAATHRPSVAVQHLHIYTCSWSASADTSVLVIGPEQHQDNWATAACAHMPVKHEGWCVQSSACLSKALNIKPPPVCQLWLA